jgi:hypothetical protein
MKQLIPKILKPVLLAGFVLMLVLFILPADTKIPDFSKTVKGDAVTLPSINAIVFDTSNIDQGDVAEMFGWIRPTAPPPPLPTSIPTKPPAPTCIPAGFLQFISKYLDEKDVRWYIFKDVRTGATIRVSAGKPDQGWELVSENDKYFTFKKNGEINCAPK